MKAEDFIQSRLDYYPALNGQYFRHNVDRDLHLFCLWENSRNKESVILSYLKDNFKIIKIFEVTWTPENIGVNFSRLYGNAPTAASVIIGEKSRATRVGAGPFLVVIVEDEHYRYAYDKTFSGKIEIINKNIADAKKHFREITGGGYKIHSSNSVGEFFRDATLIFGPDVLVSVLRELPDESRICAFNKDLHGYSGWNSFGELFRFLRFSTRYLVLRNFEYLPDSFFDNDKDLDILCHDPSDFAALINGTLKAHLPGKKAAVISVEGRAVPVDIRYLGDGYYSAVWQERMLNRCEVSNGGVMVLRCDDYFYSLLYHAKVQKKNVKAVYSTRLNQLKVKIGLGERFSDDITTDKNAAVVLGGYLKKEGYNVSKPLDRSVGYNKPFVDKIFSGSVLEKNSETYSFSSWIKTTNLFKFLVKNQLLFSALKKVWYLPSNLRKRLL